MASTAPPTAPERKVSADEAREVAEAAREQQWAAPSFVRDLFLGRLRMALIDPYPERDPEEVARARPPPGPARGTDRSAPCGAARGTGRARSWARPIAALGPLPRLRALRRR